MEAVEAVEVIEAAEVLRSGICVPVGWQIFARHGKASGRTFFPDKPTVVFNDRRE